MQAIQSLSTPIQGQLNRIFQSVRQPEYAWLTRPLLAFLSTRFIVFVSAYLAEVAIPSITGDGFYHVNPNNIFLDVWARWDSGFYLKIVDQGYWFVTGQQSSVAFFPLYPLLVSFVKPFTGSTLAAGVLVSNLCLLFALIFLYRLTKLEFDDATANRTVFYIAAFPTSFFFTAVYTESTFLLFSVATFYFARKRLWVWAALFGVLCSSARIVGFVIWGAVVLEWLGSHGWTLRHMLSRSNWLNLWQGLRRDWLNLAITLIIPAGMISYMMFLNSQFGDPLAFSTTQSAWGREMVGPLQVIYQELARLWGGDFLKGDIWYHVALDLSAFFAVVAMSAALWRRLGASYGIYSLISIIIPVSSGSTSLSRYALVIFPVFMLLGYWGRRSWLDYIIIIFFSTLLGVLTSIFVNWIFIA